MGAWESAWIAIVVSGAAAFLGAASSTWFSSRATDRVRRREQQQRDADTLGPVIAHLIAADPQRLTINLRPPDEQNAVNSALADQRDKLMGELLVMAAGHPDATIRESCRELSVALHNSLHTALWAVSELAQNRAIGTPLQAAQGDHAAAREVAERLLNEVAAYGSRRSTTKAGKRTP